VTSLCPVCAAMVSIPIKNLDVLIKEIVIEMKKEIGGNEALTGFTSVELRNYFVRNQIFPPETYFDRDFFSTEKPRVTLTYMWPATPIEKIVELLKRRYADDDTVYVDILLNDQRTPVSIQDSLKNADLRCFEFVLFRFTFKKLTGSTYMIIVDHMKDSWNRSTT
jgi:hypothetical protein